MVFSWRHCCLLFIYALLKGAFWKIYILKDIRHTINRSITWNVDLTCFFFLCILVIVHLCHWCLLLRVGRGFVGHGARLPSSVHIIQELMPITKVICRHPLYYIFKNCPVLDLTTFYLNEFQGSYKLFYRTKAIEKYLGLRFIYTTIVQPLFVHYTCNSRNCNTFIHTFIIIALPNVIM